MNKCDAFIFDFLHLEAAIALIMGIYAWRVYGIRFKTAVECLFMTPVLVLVPAFLITPIVLKNDVWPNIVLNLASGLPIIGFILLSVWGLVFYATTRLNKS